MKSVSGLKVAVIVLSVLLVTSLFLGYTGFFCKFSSKTLATDIKIGDTSLISVKPNETSVLSSSFDGAILPNERIPQVVQIVSADLDTGVFLRVKSRVFGEKIDNEISFLTDERFSLENDGYYYYNSILEGGDKTTFCVAVQLPEDFTVNENKNAVVTIVVETLDENQDINTIWKKNV